MSQRKLYAGPRCGLAGCKSTRYYRADGQLFCQNNHLSAGFQEYDIDEDEAMASGFGQRRKRGEDQVNKREKVERVAYGKSGYAAFIQAFQLIMRHQAKFITRKLDVSGFEVLLKDLWCMFLEAQSTDEKLPEPVSEEDEVVNDHANSDFESHSISEPFSDEESLPSQNNRPQYVSARYLMHRPILIHSIALCYLTLMLLRVPITIHDFRTWIVSEEFPYVRAIKYVPSQLLSHLAPGYYEALEPQIRPGTSRIWKWTQQTAIFLNLYSGIEFPALNYRPLLFSMVKELFLPLDAFNLAIRSIEALPIPLDVIPNTSTRMKNIPPETRVLCLLLVTAKLIYNIDGTDRPPPKSNRNLTIHAPNLTAWRRAIGASIASLRGTDLVSETSPEDAMQMTPEAADEYLDWYQKTWTLTALPTPQTSASARSGVPQGILDMFPMAAPTAPPIPTPSTTTPVTSMTPRDRLKTIEWLYSHPPHSLSSSHARTAGYRLTSLDPSDSTTTTTLFDDLIDLSATKYAISSSDLRKQIRVIELLVSRHDANRVR